MDYNKHINKIPPGWFSSMRTIPGGYGSVVPKIIIF